MVQIKMKQRQLFDKYPHHFATNQSLVPTVGNNQNPSNKLKSIFVNSSETQSEGNLPKMPQEYDLSEEMKPLILIGRIVFIIPPGTGNGNGKDVNSCWRTTSKLITLLIIFSTGIRVIFDFKLLFDRGTLGGLGVMQYVSTAHYFFVTLMELSAYLQFHFHSDKFFFIFEKWKETVSEMGWVHDKYLKPLAYFLCVVAILPYCSITMCFIAETYNKFNVTSPEMDMLETFYTKSMINWKNVIPYNPCIVVYFCIARVVGSISANFVVPIIIFFSRAVSFQYWKLIETVAGPETKDLHYVDMSHKDASFWEDLVCKHQAISRLMKSVNRFLSPLTFLCVSFYIYSISMQVFRLWTGEQNQYGYPLYFFIWNILMDTTTFLVTLISASKVNSNARKILNILEKCPKEYYDATGVGRLEHKINAGSPIGFSGWGCFTITRRFFLKIFSAIFSFEIMLLQSNITKLNDSTGKKNDL